MLASVETTYQEQAAQTLLVVLHATKPLYLIAYSYVDDVDYNASEAEPGPWTEDECISLSNEAEIRIKVRCPDLIKTRTPTSLPTTAQQMVTYQVDFLHRTVRDFLALGDTQRSLNKHIKSQFDPGVFICHSLLAQINGALVSGSSTWSNASGSNQLSQLLDDIYAKELELILGAPQTALLDKLESTIAQQSGNVEVNIGGNSFMGVMVEANLQRYVEAKLSVDFNISKIS